MEPVSDYVVCASPWDPYAGYTDRRFGSSVKFYVGLRTGLRGAGALPGGAGRRRRAGLADAIERAGSLDHLAVRNALAQTDLKTLYGPVKFDDSGRNVAKLMIFTQLQGGRYTVVWPEDIAWSDAVFPAPRWEDR